MIEKAALMPAEEAKKRELKIISYGDTEHEKEVRAKIKAGERILCTSLNKEEQDRYAFEKMIITNGNEAAMKAMMTWNPSTTQKGMVLSGNVGTGKSALCKCIINRWAHSKYRCRFTSAAAVMDNLKAAIEDKHTSVQRELERFYSYDLLIIDDLGVELATEWTNEKLFLIIDTRINLSKHTFYTTNLDVKSLKSRYGQRIADRLRMSCRSFNMIGPSFREILSNNDEW